MYHDNVFFLIVWGDFQVLKQQYFGQQVLFMYFLVKLKKGTLMNTLECFVCFTSQTTAHHTPSSLHKNLSHRN